MKATTIDPKTPPVEQPDDQGVPAPANTDTINTLNKLVEALLPAINKSVSKAIVDAKADPWNDIPPLEGVLPIDMPWPAKDIKVAASLTVKNMTGLSSLVLGPMTITSVSDPNASQKVGPSKPPLKVTGTLSVSAKLSKNLVAAITGKLSASYGGSTSDMKITGKATAKTVTGTAKGTFSATIGHPTSCFTALAISKNTFRLNYQDIDIDIQGDGDIFDAVLNPLIDLVDDLYGTTIKTKAAKALEEPLNDLFKSLLPLCVTAGKSGK